MEISPWAHSVSGSIDLPGSKSIAARALILGALSPDNSFLKGLPVAEDTQAMLEALQQLGFRITSGNQPNDWHIEGKGGQIPKSCAALNVQESGTAARFLPALCALHPKGVYHFTCAKSMEKRPMIALLQALEAQGASIQWHGQKGYFPFTLKSKGLIGGPISIHTDESSQFLSALLMALPYAKSSSCLQMRGTLVSAPFVQMTLELIKLFGYPAALKIQNNTVEINPHPYKGLIDKEYSIEPDATAASYFIALTTLLGGTLRIKKAGSIQLQGDIKFKELLSPYGLRSTICNGDLLFESPGLRHQRHEKHFSLKQHPSRILHFKEISDTFITFAAIAPLLPEPTTLLGLTHTRKQESNRIQSVIKNLKSIGQGAYEQADGLSLVPSPTLHPGEINSFGDHRIAMAFAVLGSYPLYSEGRAWINIKNPQVCAKTFPDFFSVLRNLMIHSQRSGP